MCSTENHERGVCYETTRYGAARQAGPAYSSAGSLTGNYSGRGGLEKIMGNYRH